MLSKKLIYIFPFILAFFTLNFGSSDLDDFNFLREFWLYLRGLEVSSQAFIIFAIRLPRVILAMLVGAILSGSGAIMQGVFKNPLVDPFLLGISSGAAFGCALSLGFLPNLPVQILAFVSAIICAFIVLFVANLAGGSKIALILSGVVMSAFLASFTGLIKFFVDPRHAQSISLWLLGSLSLASWKDAFIAFFAMMISFVPLFMMSWRIDILSLDDKEARSLGLNVKFLRVLFVLIISFCCAIAVSLSGIIGWIGLLAPHIARFIVGPKMKNLIPMSLCLGAILLIIADTLARSISVYDLPVGAITAIIGAPFFVILLKKGSWK